MNEQQSVRKIIEAAAPRRTTPVGLETRIMAQVRLRERRRRERRTIASAALYCCGVSVVLLVVLYAEFRTLDRCEQWTSIVPGAIGAIGAIGMGLTACYDRFTAVLRKLP